MVPASGRSFEAPPTLTGYDPGFTSYRAVVSLYVYNSSGVIVKLTLHVSPGFSVRRRNTFSSFIITGGISLVIYSCATSSPARVPGFVTFALTVTGCPTGALAGEITRSLYANVV